FMIRVRVPGGVVTPSQWLAMDKLTREYGSGTLRVTSRQTFQVHCILKQNLKPSIAAVNAALLDTFATSGDVNRNVLCSSNPMASQHHATVLGWARTLSNHLLPKTRAYHELWLDGERVDPATEHDPLYGKRYLPRKFKIAIAVPPTNDIDVFKDDLGLIAMFEGDTLRGFNISVGGGLATVHGDPTTYPRLADLVGFGTPEQIVAVAEQVIAVQRDLGNRVSRRHSRLKYTVDRVGVDAFKAELEKRLGFSLAPVRPYSFDHNGDRFGWTETRDGLWHLCLYLQAGRVANTDEAALLDGMRAIAGIHDGQLRLTCNQNVIIANVRPEDRERVQALVTEYGLDTYTRARRFRLDALSCVALPTCPLAMAEAERYLPHLLDKIEALLERHGLQDAAILFRLSGCPNGCSRPYLGEIGLVGRALGRYDLRLGADDRGERLNAVYRENVDEATILSELDTLFARYGAEREPAEGFGDFVSRAGVLEG
ncbi:MAG TPA: NADPH-dependent assimilatory sulfite reductase hemoprotein subunit, partial [Acetobacteraceae bacterium]|nr:NADPH-dependent assimilatory sulfite reductase hemoprotein subunit [Acetobacteraceae bacterium]